MTIKKFLSAISFLVLASAAAFYFFDFPFNGEPPAPPKRVAMLTASDLQLVAAEGVKEGLRELGYIEGRDLEISLKNPKGDRELTAKMAEEIIVSSPDLIIALSTSASDAVIKANKEPRIPMVFVDVGNFRQLGITNIQKPGNSMTGVVVDNVPAASKRMEILKTLLPKMKTVGILVNNKHVSYNEIVRAHEEAAQKLGLKINWYFVSQKEEVPPAMESLVRDGVDAFMTTSEATISGNSGLIAPVLRKAKIPSIDFNIERGIESGYLMAYGIARFDTGKQSARIIDKVLNGEDPGNIPVEFASTLKFEINAALAEEIGVLFPESLLLGADKVLHE